MNPAEVAAEVLHVATSAILKVERIKGGLTNENWVVRTAAQAVVVRLSTIHEQVLQIDRANEAAALAAADKAGIGAEVLLCAPERRLLVTRYIQGRTWTSRDARTLENIRRIAQVLQQLHALEAPNGIQPLDLQRVLSGYWRVLMEKGAATRVGTAAQRDRATTIASASARMAPACLCHNDVHHLNIIDTGRLRLVDWEYAGLGDPFFDLASVCSYHGFNEELKARLLREYLGAAPTSATERLQQMCWLFDYIRDLWFAVREIQSG